MNAFNFALLIGVLTVFCGPARAQGNDGGTAPAQLRIETGGHSKSIMAISVDAAGKFAVTASQDQTARLWDLETGKLVDTFHPATSGAYEGDLYAAAISPNSEVIVFGGITGRLWSADKSFGFYVYSRRSGALTKTVEGMKGSVSNLAFSPDGQFLAVSTTRGAAIYRVSDWSKRDFAEGFWVDVCGGAGQHRAVVVTANEIHLYTLSKEDWADTAAVTAEHLSGAQARFSADGKRILVKSNPGVGRPKLDLFSGDKLEPQTAIETGSHSVYRAIFSKDGRSVYGSLVGGQIALWPADGSKDAKIWTVIPEAERHEIPMGDLVSLSDGRVLYASARSGEWGIAGATPDKTRRVLPNLIDTSVNGIMGLAFDGSELLYGPDASTHVLFSIQKRTATTGGDFDKALGTPQVSKGSQAKSVVWSNADMQDKGMGLPPGGGSDFPVINGVTLKTDLPGIPRTTCYTVSPDMIYMASEHSLYAYRLDGTRVWKAQLSYLPSLIRRSGDGRFLVLAARDGEFHWLAADTGAEALNVFISRDGRWVMWTPSGYYDASAGGEDLIGWQVNRGGKGPLSDFYGGSRFRSRFYRPEIFPAVLKTGNEVAALKSLGPAASTGTQTRSIDTSLPPVITILSPDRTTSVSSANLTLRYAVSSPSGPVTGVSVRIDGRLISTGRGLTPADNEVQIQIPARDCEVSIIALNSSGASTPGIVKVHWTGAADANAGSAKPTLFVVSVGVSKYQNPALRLGLPAKDAHDLAAAFQEQQGRFYGDVRAQILVDEQATRAAVLRALSGVRRDARPGDFVVIFLAGHGAADDSKSYYFLPADADPTDLVSTSVRFSEITEMVSQIKARTVLFVDTCHSGDLNGARLSAVADINAIANGLSDENVGAVVFTASTGSQLALENPEWGNGAFTKALVEGLRGNAVDNGEITISTLERWVGKRVKSLTCGKQTPVCAKRVPDFTIANAAATAAPLDQTCPLN